MLLKGLQPILLAASVKAGLEESQVAMRRHMTRAPAAAVVPGLALLAASALQCAAASPPPAPALPPRSPQVMLYFTHAIGGSGGGVGFKRPTFGLRVDQVRENGNSIDPQGGDPMSHRSLLDWQMEAHHDLRVTLGRRLTYDVTNRAFGSPASRSSIRLDVPNMRNAGLAQPRAAVFAGRAGGQGGSTNRSAMELGGAEQSRMDAFPRSAFRESVNSSPLREIATAAVSALNTSHIATAMHVQNPHAATSNRQLPINRAAGN